MAEVHERLDPVERRLLDDYQRAFPLMPRPYAEVASGLDIAEGEVIDRLGRLRDRGYISRIGPVFRPRCIGSSTLAAVAVPECRIDDMAAVINEFPEVNHNYAREHELNLWFVVVAPTAARVQAVLDAVEERCGAPVLSLPLEREFRIDLGFPLWSGNGVAAGTHAHGSSAAALPAGATLPCEGAAPRRLSQRQRRLVLGIQDGLSLTPRPFARIAGELGESEPSVIDMLRTLLADSVIRRFGVIVRHHELGYRANAMVVWDVPDELVTGAGERLSRYQGVTLCYQRPRRLPRWPYNLFCMVHGRNRADVLDHIGAMRRICGLDGTPYDILFSRRRYKQRGARYGMSARSIDNGGPHG